MSGEGATPLDLDKVKWSNKLKYYWPKKNYKKIPLYRGMAMNV